MRVISREHRLDAVSEGDFHLPTERALLVDDYFRALLLSSVPFSLLIAANTTTPGPPISRFDKSLH